MRIGQYEIISNTRSNLREGLSNSKYAYYLLRREFSAALRDLTLIKGKISDGPVPNPQAIRMLDDLIHHAELLIKLQQLASHKEENAGPISESLYQLIENLVNEAIDEVC